MLSPLHLLKFLYQLLLELRYLLFLKQLVDPAIDTTSDDVEKNIEIKVVKLPDVFGKTKDD